MLYHLLGDLKDGKTSIGLLCVFLDDWHVQHCDSFTKFACLEVWYQLIFAKLRLIALRDALLLGPGLLRSEHTLTGIVEDFYSVFTPLFFSLILRVERVNGRIVLKLDLEDEFLDVRAELLLDRSLQVRVEGVSDVLKVGRVSELLWWPRLQRMEINLTELVLDGVQVHDARLDFLQRLHLLKLAVLILELGV